MNTPPPGGPSAARPRFHFPKSARVRRRAEYLRVQGTDVRVTTAHVVLLLARRPEGSHTGTRVGLVASRKVGGAVQRNRGKRLVRELFRTRPELFPVGGAVDCVVILRAGVHTLSLQALAAQLESVSRHVVRRTLELSRRPARR